MVFVFMFVHVKNEMSEIIIRLVVQAMIEEQKKQKKSDRKIITTTL